MKKQICGLIVIALLAAPAILTAGGGQRNDCATKYPLVLAHGMGFTAKVLGVIDYWWGTEEALSEQGAEVYITAVNAMDGTAKKALAWRAQVLQILAASGKGRVNVIGHSHGAIYTRYAISNLGLSPKVASFTSLAGPHRGSRMTDLTSGMVPESLQVAFASAMDIIYVFLFGDTNPDSLQNQRDMAQSYMVNTFNPNTPDVPGLYYQSWAARIKWAAPSLVLEPSWLIVKALEGENDGLVSVASARWANFRGIQDGAWWSPGVDHANIIGHLFGVTPGFDSPAFFVDVVRDLKARGF